MSQFQKRYLKLKEENPDILYLFKSGVFYIALNEDASFLSEQFNFKITNLNAETTKCGFPCNSFDKYCKMLNIINKEFKIIDNNVISTAESYISNKQLMDILTTINKTDLKTLSVSHAFELLEKIQTISSQFNNHSSL